MNPRHRRLIIPGLLLGLLVVVVVTALVREARAVDDSGGAEEVSVLSDSRIVESSGLAVSAVYDDLAYTVNDSGHDPLVFAVRISTGETVGVTELQVDWVDVEALGLGPDGTLWVADIGDNAAVRDEVRLYALPEPGEADATVSPEVYRLQYPKGPVDAEAIAVDPRDGALHILTKEMPAGGVFTLPEEAAPGELTELTPGPRLVPPLTTDASFHPDGSAVAVRTYFEVHDYDPETWSSRSQTFLPPQPQGETLAFEPGSDSYLIGSEGADSVLWRLSWAELADVRDPGPVATTTAPEDAPASAMGRSLDGGWLWLVVAVGLGSMIVVAFMLNRRR